MNKSTRIENLYSGNTNIPEDKNVPNNIKNYGKNDNVHSYKSPFISGSSSSEILSSQNFSGLADKTNTNKLSNTINYSNNNNKDLTTSKENNRNIDQTKDNRNLDQTASKENNKNFNTFNKSKNIDFDYNNAKSNRSDHNNPYPESKLINNNKINNPEKNDKFERTDSGVKTNVIDKTDKRFSLNHQDYIWEKLVGIENLGNTCFISTTIQCLYHSKNFMRYFLHHYNQDKIDLDQIGFSLFQLISLIIETKNFDSVSIEEFKYNFSDKFQKYEGFSQNDCQEFMRCLLEELNDNLNLVKGKNKITPFASKETDLKKFNIEYDQHFKKQENSIVTEFFYGQIFNQFSCANCTNNINSCEKFLDLPVSIPTVLGTFDLVKLMEGGFINNEQMELAPCEGKSKRCKNKVFFKESKITKLPEILVISLQRYNYRNRTKNEAKIKIYEEIDLNRIIDKSKLIEKSETKYRLYAITHHKGNLDFGHYWTNCKIQKRWYEFNDSKVKELRDIDLVSETVYVLFYEKIQSQYNE